MKEKNEGKGKRERNTSNNEKGRMGFFKCVSGVLITCKSTSPERERDGCYGCAQAEIETRHQT